jgi:pyruvate/2-oxoglutarate dehydrogenase complex dihydrolipoamide dehydrogenase (E3) component
VERTYDLIVVGTGVASDLVDVLVRRSRELGIRISARRLGGETAAGFRVLVGRGTRRILGAHLLGPPADEVVNVFALAIRSGLRAEDLRQTLFAYPTSAADIPSMV